MARRGKIKYKDIVKKGAPQSRKKQKQPQRKSYSLYKNANKTKFGAKRKQNDSEDIIPRKKKIKEPVEKVPEERESSSEEEERDLDNLLKSFGSACSKKTEAIESSSESEDEEERRENSESTIEDRGDAGSDVEFSIIANNDEEEIDLGTQDENLEDPFAKHLFYDLHDGLVDCLQRSPLVCDTYAEIWPTLGRLHTQIPKSDKIADKSTNSQCILEKKTFAPEGSLSKRIPKASRLEDLFIKSQVLNNVAKVSKREHLSPLQLEMFSVINNYQDFCYSERTSLNAEDVRFVYCLHAVNHIMKTRGKIVHHNAKLSKKEDVPEEFRDQGLVRPKVLIVVPFKDAAYKIVRMIIDLILPEDKGNVMNKNRFIEDYTGNELYLPKRNPKPEDYEQLFQGNSSDDFKIGITVTKKSLKLYADFYSSDIIIASPLGLRTVIGAEGEPERDHDFLASTELLVLDQTEIFLMQNWDHVLHIFNHLHLLPKDVRGTDFSRVRTWSLNGWAKYYRQTLLFSSVALPEINGIFNKKCLNYAGKVKVVNPAELGCIGQVVVQVPHVFHKFECSGPSESIDARFDVFVGKVLPQQKESLLAQTMVFVPSYFDYVRIRNHFKKEDVSFVQICEYSKDAKIARARDMFFHGDAHFLLYTERFHFFNRKRIKGIRHLVFYQLPVFPHFYYEICNLMQEANQNRKLGNKATPSVSVIYSKYDLHQLSAIVGAEKAQKMVQSDRTVHMMITGAQ